MKHYSGLNIAFQWNQKAHHWMDFLVGQSGRNIAAASALSSLWTGATILNIRLDLLDSVCRIRVRAEEFGRLIA